MRATWDLQLFGSAWNKRLDIGFILAAFYLIAATILRFVVWRMAKENGAGSPGPTERPRCGTAVAQKLLSRRRSCERIAEALVRWAPPPRAYTRWARAGRHRSPVEASVLLPQSRRAASGSRVHDHSIDGVTRNTPRTARACRLSCWPAWLGGMLALRLLDDLVWTQRVHDLFALRAGVAGDDEEVVGALSDRLPLSG
jgi:hypothetical protein